MVEVIEYPIKQDWPKILQRPIMDLTQIESKVLPIIEAVKIRGDEALKELTNKFEGVNLLNFLVTEEEFKEANNFLSDLLKEAINVAKLNIEKFHVSQRELVVETETMPGVVCWRKSIPIQKVGLYIPGGTAPLFSTILMLGIPATIAGCKEIIICSPPNKEGKIHPAMLYTAELLGIKKVYKLGGAQAIAAMGVGTETVPKVYKIFGPGNQYVTAAKQAISRLGVAIDMPAGPSEVAVIADSSCNPSFVAADLLSQAEHGGDSQVIFATDSKKILEMVIHELESQINFLPRKELATQAIKNSKFILMNSILEAIDLINDYAPEHLILQLNNLDHWSSKVINAGSVFLGNYTPESAGDYASGTNHTLPTNGYARSYSGVSLDSFLKKVTYQHISEQGLLNLGPTVELMASTEQLYAHQNAVSIRLKEIKNRL